jgi:peptide/nickel transport system ATP-binding protein
MSETLLEISNLAVEYPIDDRPVRVVDGVDLVLKRGRIMGVVGESGSGKSVTAYSILGLLDHSGRVPEGSIVFDGVDLLRLSEKQLRSYRGNRIAMIFQDPMTTLNPVLTIGAQMADTITAHASVGARDARDRCIEALRKVGIANPETRIDAYPHELSGGMRQRVAIATAMLNNPALLIADEPTTALDVTIQAQILSEVQKVLAASSTSALWISHDLSVVSSIADEIAVMYGGRVVEIGPADEIITNAAHPYTVGLLNAFPDASEPGTQLRQIRGNVGSPASRPSGCSFRNRCDRATDACASRPPRVSRGPGHSLWCFHPVVKGQPA